MALNHCTLQRTRCLSGIYQRSSFYVVSPSCRRQQSTARAAPSSEPDIREVLRNVIPEKREQLKLLKSRADKKIGEVKVENVLGGMRGLQSMIWEGSTLDANEGIRFHGHTIADCRRLLPKGKTGQEMLPEAMFWLLLTGQIPSEEQVRQFSRELAMKSGVRDTVTVTSKISKSSPMAQLASALSLESGNSAFAHNYHKGTMPKEAQWESTLEDVILLLGKLPNIAAGLGHAYRSQRILKSKEDNGKRHQFTPYFDWDQDWAHNFANNLGFGHPGEKNEGFQDLLRLYLALHSDHEGGNVSAHTVHLVGSALNSPQQSYAAGVLGLAGPLHGAANEQALSFILEIQKSLPESPDSATITDYLRTHLATGQVIPGYGHAVLRGPDPRFTALMDFATSHPSVTADPLFQLAKQVTEIAPVVLAEQGKARNPNPNVDALSGVLLWHYGLRSPSMHTVVFAVSRALGTMAQLVWDRALGLPIERPKSVDMKTLLAMTE